MAEDHRVTATSLQSFAEAADEAWAQVPGDPNREGLREAEVSRMWITGGGVVGTEYNVELLVLRPPQD